MTIRALELYCGIGGFSAAVEAIPGVQVSLALDQSELALQAYQQGFTSHPARSFNLEDARPSDLAAAEADFWWLSPPCQPYTIRGPGRDLEDPRARSLIRVLALLRELRPRHLALENVEGFARSRALDLLRNLLVELGYDLRERVLCPTELGIPSRRPRFYLVTSLDGLRPVDSKTRPATRRQLSEYLDSEPDEKLGVASNQLSQFENGLRILDPTDPNAYTTCFTSGYGKSLMHSGSYLRNSNGTVRRFSPREILRLLHFPQRYQLPESMSLRTRWKLAGNSLSVAAVREILKDFDFTTP